MRDEKENACDRCSPLCWHDGATYESKFILVYLFSKQRSQNHQE